ncbi:outer envelope pore protein 16-4, chloroplastic-like isoform X3 [Salvia splendens]|uniref:outer envelope pore protein 16-4, chloroplastic-like isoform X3 n=1 Tax=Salvia splendens TaxID=180675 RepID=UPI001C270B52|nr:outer envelope pore protein 16-4, chloroplastic-like isoform X3 [Salvia splendens]XP_042034608.1 outer envelope pore protein 16-4, chloroplastic-like isoform X3 [Salvia splendens]
MEADPVVHLPCSSIAVDSVLRLSSAGAIWGACYGPFAAKRLGLSGSYRASYIAKTVGQCGFYCGLFAAIFSFSHCGIQRYRRRNDWINTLSAGVVAGAAFGVGTRNWKQVAGITGLSCTFFQLVKDSKSV